jgi:hypothetical protein
MNAGAAESAAAPLTAPSLTTKEDWGRFVTAEPPCKPAVPDLKEFASWGKAQQRRFDAARTRYHDDFGLIAVPAMRQMRRDLLPRIISNANSKRPGARRGAIVDGLGGVGKTTMITHLGKLYERYARSLYPNPRTQAGGQYIPVVYVTLPAQATIKGLNRALAHFYGIVTPRTRTTDELGYIVVEHARLCATGLVMVDDVHFLNLNGNKEHQAVNDHLKYLANTISATFVFAGIDCEGTGLLSEGKDRDRKGRSTSQTRRRFSLHRVEPFSVRDDAHRREWVALLKNVESKLVLLRAVDGMLYRRLPEYLYERTGGYLGSLEELVSRGASLAVETGEECMTQELLDSVLIDYAAETQRRLKGA